MQPDRVDVLSESLARTLLGCDDVPLALALLRGLASGAPVAASTLGERAEAVLAGWPNVDYDKSGRVVAFSGLSLTPTAHRFTVGGRLLYTWCAWDTLFLPAMLGQSAEVESTCPVAGSDVRLTVDPNGVRRADPEPLWVSFPAAATTSTADITGAFWCHVHFLATLAAAEQWLSQHSEGTVLDLDEAYALGRKATRCCAG